MNAQAMFDLVRANEEAPDFDLHQWECGTYGCLLGNYNIRFDRLDECSYSSGALDLDISLAESVWLFSTYNPAYGDIGMLFLKFPGQGMHQVYDLEKLRPGRDRSAALSRVRKFLYYKLHKRELCYDERGCVRETARRAEGDHHIVRHAARRALAAV